VTVLWAIALVINMLGAFAWVSLAAESTSGRAKAFCGTISIFSAAGALQAAVSLVAA
jgi:hypothetical protein